MFTQSFTHHTRFGFALMMAVLIGLPAASALADKSDNNGKSDQGKHSARSAQTQTPGPTRKPVNPTKAGHTSPTTR